MFKIEKATLENIILKVGIAGPSGAGKTYSALSVASHLNLGSVCVIDTENGSSKKYANDFDFDVLTLDEHNPKLFEKAIEHVEGQGKHGIIIIDSLSHAWFETLQLHAHESDRVKNSFAAWKGITPIWNAMIKTILQSKLHIFTTMRSKTEYIQETNDQGKKIVRKVGMAPVVRDGTEYEFDFCFDMDTQNTAVVTKSRAGSFLAIGAEFEKPGANVANVLRAWMGLDPETTNNNKPAKATPSKTVTAATEDEIERCKEKVLASGGRFDDEEWETLNHKDLIGIITKERLVEIFNAAMKRKPADLSANGAQPDAP